MKLTANAKKRVEVAKDALLRLKKGDYVAESGIFAEFSEGNLRNDYCIGKQLNELLPHMGTCKVCAMGGLLISLVRKDNSFKVSPSMNGDEGICIEGDDTEKRLLKLFSKRQIVLIEIAFEKGEGWYSPGGMREMEFDEEQEDAADMYPDMWDYEDRLRAILHNIIRNNGDFVVTRRKRRTQDSKPKEASCS